MMNFLLGGVIGLVLGWLFVPMPTWVLHFYEKIKVIVTGSL